MLNNATENLKLTSSTIQKDIVSAFASETFKEIIKDIGNDLFSVLVDEPHDVSTTKQSIAHLVRNYYSSWEVAGLNPNRYKTLKKKKT